MYGESPNQAAKFRRTLLPSLPLVRAHLMEDVHCPCRARFSRDADDSIRGTKRHPCEVCAMFVVFMYQLFCTRFAAC